MSPPPITSTLFPDHELSFSHLSTVCKSAYCHSFSTFCICLRLSYFPDKIWIAAFISTHLKGCSSPARFSTPHVTVHLSRTRGMAAPPRPGLNNPFAPLLHSAFLPLFSSLRAPVPQGSWFPLASSSFPWWAPLWGRPQCLAAPSRALLLPISVISSLVFSLDLSSTILRGLL